MTPGSLRSRLLTGAVLWTAGLFVVTGSVFTFTIEHYPTMAGHVHDTFRHIGSALALAGVLMLVGLAFVRRGVSPLQRLREKLQAVREGRSDSVSGQYPSEVQPLVDDLNALIDHRSAAVGRAITRAGDLAHGLKTPLAVLAHEAERARAGGQHELATRLDEQIARMRRQIDYHLTQARAAASGPAPGTHCPVSSVAEALARTLRRLYAARGLDIAVDSQATHAVKVQQEDLEEMLGNLLDNACKWTRRRVRVTSEQVDARVTIAIDDDGEGLPPHQREAALTRGARLDEAAPGSGLGLAIVRDLAAQYDGSIELRASPLGGLRAQLDLPASRPA